MQAEEESSMMARERKEGFGDGGEGEGGEAATTYVVSPRSI